MWLRVVFALGITGTVVFAILGIGNHWTWNTCIRAVVMLVATIVTSIAVAEWTAAILTPTKLLRNVLHGFFVAVTLLAMLGFMAPSSLRELSNADLLAPVWMLPPAGWLASLSGQFPPNLMRDFVTPLVALLSVVAACVWLPRSMVVKDIRLLQNLRVEAIRKGWITQWVKPQSGTWSKATINRRDILVKQLQLQRLGTVVPDGNLSDVRAFAKFFRTIPLASCLLLLCRSLPGVWAVAFSTGLLVINDRISFVVAPWFVLMIFIFGCYLPLWRRGGWMHDVLKVGSASTGQTSFYFLFPISTDALCADVFCRHFLRLASASPGWLIAVLVMHQTDMPSDMIWHGLGLVVASSYLMPAMACVSMLIDGWRPAFWGKCLEIVVGIASVVSAFGCGLVGPVSSYVRLRPEAAWSYLMLAGLVIGSMLTGMAYLTHRMDLAIQIRSVEDPTR